MDIFKDGFTEARVWDLCEGCSQERARTVSLERIKLAALQDLQKRLEAHKETEKKLLTDSSFREAYERARAMLAK